jgi:hypothetical protein
MERSRLRARTGKGYVLLNPVLHELVREGKIKMSENFVSLINR